MTVYDMARAYYPRLWDDGRLDQLVAAGRLSAEEATQIRADLQAPASAAKQWHWENAPVGAHPAGPAGMF